MVAAMNDKSEISDSQKADQDALVKLAVAHFGKLTPAEEKLFRKTAAGEEADYRSSNEDENDPAGAEDWGEDRVLQAERIAWLCADKRAREFITHRGLRIQGARIVGVLDLEEVRFPYACELQGCAITDGANLRESRFLKLILSGSRMGTFCADGMEVEGSVFLSHGFHAQGVVRILRITIGGNLVCERGTFINDAGPALVADGMTVEGSVFLTDRFYAKGAVRLFGASIGGSLECTNGTFINNGSPINPNYYALVAEGMRVKGNAALMNGFKAEGEVSLHWATIGGNLVCEKGAFINHAGPALSADGMRVEGSVCLRDGFKAEGEVKLLGATIGVNLECLRGTFIYPDDSALSADGIKVGGDVILGQGFEAEGEVRLLRASIGGNLDCDKGSFINTDDPALSADGMQVGGGVLLRNSFRAEGEVKLVGATIGGSLDCVNGTFINPDGDAIGADGMTVKGSVLLRDHFKAEGEISLVGAIIHGQFQLWNVASDSDFELNLRSAHIGVLRDEPTSWPTKGKLHLHGLVYDDIAKEASSDAKTRVEWLKLQEDETYFPQPYEQLATVLKKNGQVVDARNVLVAKEKFRRAKGALSLTDWLLYYVFGWWIGYGYRPLWALWPALIIIVLGALLFWCGEDQLAPTGGAPYSASNAGGSSPYPTFNPIVYSLDTFIPIVDFHQVKFRLPSARMSNNANARPWWSLPGFWLLVWFWIEVGAGWVISSVLVIGVTRFVRS